MELTWSTLDATEVDVGAGDDNEYFLLDLHKPQNRYNRIRVNRGTANAALRSAQYIIGGHRKAPEDSGTNYNAYFHIGGEDGEEHTNPKA